MGKFENRGNKKSLPAFSGDVASISQILSVAGKFEPVTAF